MGTGPVGDLKMNAEYRRPGPDPDRRRFAINPEQAAYAIKEFLRQFAIPMLGRSPSSPASRRIS
jgi:hypothetical protein